MRTATCISPRGGVEGSVILFEASFLEVVALDKSLEAQRMEILQRGLPARFNALFLESRRCANSSYDQRARI